MPQFEKLSFAKDEVRLMELLPGSFNDRLGIRLRVIDLVSDESYEALSYHWGTAIAENPAYINEAPLEITANLDTALRYLRLSDQVRTLWIDAICINQQDIPEKSHQVQMMTKIYAKATTVLVWLGEPDGDSDFVFDFLKDSIITSQEAPRLILAVSRFLRRSWFERIWIIQEIVLARASPKVLCGQSSCNWEDLGRFVGTTTETSISRSINGSVRSDRFWSWVRTLKSDDNVWISVLSQATGEDWHAWELYMQLVSLTGTSSNLKTIAWYQHYRETGIVTPEISSSAQWLVRGSLARNQIRLVEIMGLRIAGASGSLALRVRFTQNKRSTDPRDRIFGILGITRFTNGVISPDYSLSSESIFSQAMSVIIRESFTSSYQWLHLQSRNRSHHLPSWVPDFTQNELPGSLRHVNDLISWEALETKSTHIIARFSENHKVLYTVGSMMGKITAVCKILLLDNDVISKMKDEVRILLQKYFGLFVSLVKLGISWDTILDTLLGHSKERSVSANTLLLGTLDRLRNDVLSDSPSVLFDEQTATLYKSIRNTCNKRFLFVTDTMKIGVSPYEVQEGDVLAGLFGIDFPFVLREADDHYTMINIAHVGDHSYRFDIPQGLNDEVMFEEFGLQSYEIH